MFDFIDRGPRPIELPAIAVLDQLAETLSPRRTREPIELYRLRVARNRHALRSAVTTSGNPLHRYLTRLQQFTPASDRTDALRHAARQALERTLTAEST